MIKGEFEYLRNLAKFNLCAEHQTPLEVARHPEDACYVLRCDHPIESLEDVPDGAQITPELEKRMGHYPDALIHNPTLTEQWKQGKLDDSTIVDKIKRGARRRTMQQPKQSTAITFEGIPATDLGTGNLLSPELISALVAYAKKYHLDPTRGHVVLMYGKPYIGLDGYLFHANQSGIAYSLRSRPLNSLELKQYKIGPTDFGWIAELELLESGAGFNGIGIVTYEEMTERSSKDPSKFRAPVVAKHPWQLAQKRAEWHVLRRGFPIGETNEEQEK